MCKEIACKSYGTHVHSRKVSFTGNDIKGRTALRSSTARKRGSELGVWFIVASLFDVFVALFDTNSSAKRVVFEFGPGAF